MKTSDEELLKDYLSGDERGFEELLQRYKGPLFTVILRMVGSMADSEDIFQETFSRVLSHAGDFRMEKKFSPWVYAIATNLCRDHLRRSGKNPLPLDDETVPSPLPDPESEVSESEVRRAVSKALDALPPEQREVYLLREYGDLSFKQIAKVTGSKLNTVLGRMHLAMKRLKSELSYLSEDGT